MKKQYNFSVIITQDETGKYIANVPSLQGCHTQADDINTLYERLEEVISLCVEVEKEKNNFVPEDKFIGIHQLQLSI